MVTAIPVPGLYVLPAAAGAGKTLVAGAIADWFRRRGARVAVLVPLQTGAVHRREGLVSQDAEFLAVCANSHHPLDLICPQRFAENLIPAVSAERSGRPIDCDAIDRSVRLMSRDSDVMIVQSPGTIMTPLDRKWVIMDLIAELRAPAVIVTRAGLEEINSLVLTVNALRNTGVAIAGIVVNRYPADGPSLDQELSLRELEKWSKAPLLCVVPEEKFIPPQLPPGITAPMDLVDWRGKAAAAGS